MKHIHFISSNVFETFQEKTNGNVFSSFVWQVSDLTKELLALESASPADIARVIESYHEQVTLISP